MSIFVVLVSTLLICVSGCTNKAYVPNSDNKYTNSLVFSDSFNKAIYNTNHQIYSNSLTGITLIKKTDSSYRVVSMSELGMKYFDFEFPFRKNSNPINHYVMSPLNKALLVKMIQNDFSLLFYPFGENSSVILKNDTNEEIIKNGRILYIRKKENGITEIRKKRWLLKDKVLANLSDYYISHPDTIIFDHGKISMKLIELKD